MLDIQVSRFVWDVTAKVNAGYLQHFQSLTSGPPKALGATAFQIGLIFEASKAYFGEAGGVSDTMLATLMRQVRRLLGNLHVAAEVLRSARAAPEKLVGRFFEAGRREASNCLRDAPNKDALLDLFKQE